ncbi:hypothetical protein P3T39_000919 [Kitasatospora sp. GP82]|nr:hypothetical protein [Kitasatospora sp. GP82]
MARVTIAATASAVPSPGRVGRGRGGVGQAGRRRLRGPRRGQPPQDVSARVKTGAGAALRSTGAESPQLVSATRRWGPGDEWPTVRAVATSRAAPVTAMTIRRAIRARAGMGHPFHCSGKVGEIQMISWTSVRPRSVQVQVLPPFHRRSSRSDSSLSWVKVGDSGIPDVQQLLTQEARPQPGRRRSVSAGLPSDSEHSRRLSLAEALSNTRWPAPRAGGCDPCRDAKAGECLSARPARPRRRGGRVATGADSDSRDCPSWPHQTSRCDSALRQPCAALRKPLACAGRAVPRAPRGLPPRAPGPRLRHGR